MVLHQDDLLVHLVLEVDPRVLNFLDIDATVDTLFPIDSSYSGCNSLSGEIFECCSDDSMSTSS
jgi:hypothetical protein